MPAGLRALQRESRHIMARAFLAWLRLHFALRHRAGDRF